jgi:hypothetical protein
MPAADRRSRELSPGASSPPVACRTPRKVALRFGAMCLRGLALRFLRRGCLRGRARSGQATYRRRPNASRGRVQRSGQVERGSSSHAVGPTPWRQQESSACPGQPGESPWPGAGSKGQTKGTTLRQPPAATETVTLHRVSAQARHLLSVCTRSVDAVHCAPPFYAHFR